MVSKVRIIWKQTVAAADCAARQLLPLPPLLLNLPSAEEQQQTAQLLGQYLDEAMVRLQIPRHARI